MTKIKRKGLSMLLAIGLVVSSFSSLNSASAAIKTETGKLTVDGGIRNLISEKSKSDLIPTDEVVGNVSIDTYDHDNLSDIEFVKASHVSGDKLLTIKKKGGEFYFVVRSKASGKEVINVRYEAIYDRNDEKVKVKANKDLTFYANKNGEVFLGKAGLTSKTSRPDDIPTVAVNQKYLDIGVYYAEAAGETGIDKITANYSGVDVNTVKAEEKPVYVIKDSGNAVKINSDALELKSSKIFNKIVVASLSKKGGSEPDADAYKNGMDGDLIDNNVIRLVTTFEGQTAAEEDSNLKKASAKLVNVGSNTLQIKLGSVSDAATYASLDSSQQDIPVSSEKKYDADLSLNDGVSKLAGDNLQINKKGGKTYVNVGHLNWNSSNAWNEHQKTMDAAVSVGSYDKILTTKHVDILGGSIGELETNNTKTIVVEDGKTGDLTSGTVEVQAGSVQGEISAKIVHVSDGTVKAINNDAAVVTIDGGEITGNITGKTIEIDAKDDAINTVIGGNVTAKGDNDANVEPTIQVHSGSDATVTVKGELKGAVTVEGDHIHLETINMDYKHTAVFHDFTGSVKATVNAGNDTAVEIHGESVVSLSGKLAVDSVEIEEDSELTVAEAAIGSINGDGQFVFPAGKLHVTNGIDDTVRLIISDGLAVGATAFTSNKDAVSHDRLNIAGSTLQTNPASNTADKQVLTAVAFSGLKFNKKELRIAKGHSDTLTVKSYPSDLPLPAGAKIEWSVNSNTDYMTVTVDETTQTATINVTNFNAEHAMDNEGKITAAVVDESGNVIGGLLKATVKVTGLEKPDSKVTLDAAKPVTLASAKTHEYIAQSSSGAALTAVSSNPKIATVTLLNTVEPQGSKFQIHAIAEGNVTITTKDANDATASLEVTVVKPEQSAA